MSILKEFKEFAIKGNAVDMAVGIIIGAAFGKVISSLVADVIPPPIGVLLGGVDFTKLAVTLNYGNFIQSVVDFTIIAFAIFMMVNLINKLRKQEAAAPAALPEPTKEAVLLTEIRDLLKAKS